jgi:hypothetical protein
MSAVGCALLWPIEGHKRDHPNAEFAKLTAKSAG